MDKSNLKYQLLENSYDKNSVEYKKLVSSLKDLEYIQTDLHNIIIEQNSKIKNINKNNDSIKENFTISNNDLEICDKYYFSYKPIVIGSLIGAIFISPTTALLRIKYLGLTTSFGAILGGFSGYKIQQ